MTVAYEPFRRWKDNYQSLCNGPVTTQAPCDLDPEHPAVLFSGHYEALKCRNAGALPYRRQLESSALHAYTRWLFLFERESHYEGPRFLVRRTGSAVTEMMHRDYTGRFLDEFTSEDCYESRFYMLDDVCQTQQPGYARICVDTLQNCEFKQTVLLGAFPFAADPHGDLRYIALLIAPESAALRAHL